MCQEDKEEIEKLKQLLQDLMDRHSGHWKVLKEPCSCATCKKTRETLGRP